MNHLLHLKIGPRLAVLLSAVLGLLVLVAATGLWGQSSLFGLVRQAFERDVALATAASDLHVQVLQARRFEKDILLNLQRPEAVTAYAEKWRQARKRAVELLATVRRLETAGGSAPGLDEMARDLNTYATQFEALVASIGAGPARSAADANAELDRVRAAIRNLEKATDELNDHAMERAGSVVPDLERSRDRLALQVVALSLVALLTAAAAGWWTARSITQPLHRAVGVAEAVARGELCVDIQVAGHDETARLLDALRHMTERLRHLVSDIRASSDSIATGSGQIATGNGDLSRRTEHQASNLQETAASMEELGAAVAANASGAQQARQLADAAADAARQGGGVVGDVVQTMDSIAQSSRQIADITGLIDGIAFQTNILALNAAVEAARAGEHGRGFAVVAGEVRNLAQRSAEAARQISTLIGSSTGRIRQGAELAQEAGQTIEGLVQQVQQVAALVREISGSSSQQDEGLRQVGQAVAQLDRMTQQNAALVEQSAAAAESLRQQAERLAQAVSAFRV
ncbi:MAG: methyl-accepting chemotaxis protein [Rubrivivax sp.]